MVLQKKMEKIMQKNEKKVLTSEKCHDIIYKLSGRDVRIAKTISFEF